jgi:hypothetical protein
MIERENTCVSVLLDVEFIFFSAADIAFSSLRGLKFLHILPRPSINEHQSACFNSPELKAQVSFSDRPLFVCLSDFNIFDFFSRTTGPTLDKVGTFIIR